MILFTILALTLVFLVAFTIFVISLGGSIFIVIFGDVIVCVAIIVWILKKLVSGRKES